MTAKDPMIGRIDTATSTMLEPASISEFSMRKALSAISEHRIDDADLYFQTTRQEAWVLEDGNVKEGSFKISQGVGVRAVAGEKAAYAYSDDLSAKSLMEAACTVRTIAKAEVNPNR